MSVADDLKAIDDIVKREAFRRANENAKTCPMSQDEFEQEVRYREKDVRRDLEVLSRLGMRLTQAVLAETW